MNDRSKKFKRDQGYAEHQSGTSMRKQLKKNRQAVFGNELESEYDNYIKPLYELFEKHSNQEEK
jgi:hypothetical protein